VSWWIYGGVSREEGVACRRRSSHSIAQAEKDFGVRCSKFTRNDSRELQFSPDSCDISSKCYIERYFDFGNIIGKS
jgi:hypothetical protein